MKPLQYKVVGPATQERSLALRRWVLAQVRTLGRRARDILWIAPTNRAALDAADWFSRRGYLIRCTTPVGLAIRALQRSAFNVPPIMLTPAELQRLSEELLASELRFDPMSLWAALPSRPLSGQLRPAKGWTEAEALTQGDEVRRWMWEHNIHASWRLWNMAEFYALERRREIYDRLLCVDGMDSVDDAAAAQHVLKYSELAASGSHDVHWTNGGRIFSAAKAIAAEIVPESDPAEFRPADPMSPVRSTGFGAIFESFAPTACVYGISYRQQAATDLASLAFVEPDRVAEDVIRTLRRAALHCLSNGVITCDAKAPLELHEPWLRTVDDLDDVLCLLGPGFKPFSRLPIAELAFSEPHCQDLLPAVLPERPLLSIPEAYGLRFARVLALGTELRSVAAEGIAHAFSVEGDHHGIYVLGSRQSSREATGPNLLGRRQGRSEQGDGRVQQRRLPI